MLISQVHLEPNCHASLLLCTFSLHLPSISYVQSSGQLTLWAQLLSTHACNHMNAKKGIQLLLILAIHCHTTESAAWYWLILNNFQKWIKDNQFDEFGLDNFQMASKLFSSANFFISFIKFKVKNSKCISNVINGMNGIFITSPSP